MNSNELTYYQRQISFTEFGLESQIKIKAARVLVVGAGGLGCPALQYLAGIGVGKIGIVDADFVSESNLHRQVLYDISCLGLKKVEVAKRKLQLLNPNSMIESFAVFLTLENAFEIISNYDIVVDCTDNLATRYLINDVCVLVDKPMVYGAIHKFEGQLSIFNHKNGPTYRCVFPEQKENENILNCAESGVIGVLPGIIGILQATEVIKWITGFGELLTGKLMFFNLLTYQSHKINISRKEIDYKSELTKNGIQLVTFDCENMEDYDFDPNNFDFSKEYLFLDVRNTDELPILKGNNLLQIPLNELDKRWVKISKEKQIICFCASGIRSSKAIKLLEKRLNKNLLFNVSGGISKKFIELWETKKN